MNQRYFALTTLVPNGKRASFAILKNCFPKGIPTIVTHKMHPIIAFVIASSIPDMHIHRIFKRNETAPPSSTISFPKGFKEIDERIKNIEQQVSRSQDQIKEVNEGIKMLGKAEISLINHLIDGNGIDAMRKEVKELTDYFIEKG